MCLKRKKKIILCGDFNIDILKENHSSLGFQTLLNSFNLKLGVRVPTRLCSGTCIDNIIHNIRGSKCEIIELAVSDHTAQLLRCPVKKTCILPYWFKYKRHYSKENVLKFKTCLQNLTFNDIYSCNNPNDAFNQFHDIFKLFYDMCFPHRKLKVYPSKKAQID